MFKKFLTPSGSGSPAPRSLDGPYQEDSTNLIYHLLFCDRPDLFKTNHGGELSPPWATLFRDDPDPDEVAGIAGDESQESRVRMLAYGWLREAGKPVPAKELLGTIIEVRMPEGLDTLAAFSDGGARYINHTGKIAVVEGSPGPFQTEIDGVIRASRPIVSAIGPWDRERLPAPVAGNVRMTFLVSDGLYFGEGPMEVLQRDGMAAPLIQAATLLLMRLAGETSDS